MKRPLGLTTVLITVFTVITLYMGASIPAGISAWPYDLETAQSGQTADRFEPRWIEVNLSGGNPIQTLQDLKLWTNNLWVRTCTMKPDRLTLANARKLPLQGPTWIAGTGGKREGNAPTLPPRYFDERCRTRSR